jgi:hypothetical protein
MSSFLSTSIAPRVDLHLVRRDYFDGMGILLQTASGTAYDLADVDICASVWKRTGEGSYSLVTSVNVEKQEPTRLGQIRIWLTSAQTAAIWDAYGTATLPSASFFPSAYSQEVSIANTSPLVWDVRVETKELSSTLLSVASGVFSSQTNHGLASSERIIFSGTTSSGINFDGTGARVYSGLTSLSYLSPYRFTVPTLSGVTASGLGGSVYRLKQDTVIAGNVIVGPTVSNCFI